MHSSNQFQASDPTSLFLFSFALEVRGAVSVFNVKRKDDATIHTKLTQTQLKNKPEIQTIRYILIHVARSILYGIVDVHIKSSKVRLFYTLLKKLDSRKKKKQANTSIAIKSNLLNEPSTWPSSSLLVSFRFVSLFCPIRITIIFRISYSTADSVRSFSASPMKKRKRESSKWN